MQWIKKIEKPFMNCFFTSGLSIVCIMQKQRNEENAHLVNTPDAKTAKRKVQHRKAQICLPFFLFIITINKKT